MTKQTLSQQQIDEIEAKVAELRTRIDRRNPWPSDNESHWTTEGWKAGTRNALDKLHVEALLAEVCRLRGELERERENYQAYRIGSEGAKEMASRRIAALEGPAVDARAALAALCYDLEDPGTAALGALYLLQQATVGVDAPRDDAALALARHDATVMRRCAEFVRDTYSGEWADDAAATLERDADITERGCPGFEKEYQGVSDAKWRLANCKHCGKPRTEHAAPAVVAGDGQQQ